MGSSFVEDTVNFVKTHVLFARSKVPSLKRPLCCETLNLIQRFRTNFPLYRLERAHWYNFLYFVQISYDWATGRNTKDPRRIYIEFNQWRRKSFRFFFSVYFYWLFERLWKYNWWWVFLYGFLTMVDNAVTL